MAMGSKWNRYIKWENYQKRVQIPSNDIERTRLHYYGCIIWRNTNVFLYNCLSLLLFPLVWFIAKRNCCEDIKENVDALIVCPDRHYLLKDEDIPEKLKNTYAIIKKYSIERKTLYKELFSCSIDKTGREIIIQLLKKYPFSFYMNLSVLLHISRYNRLITKYNPKAFITTQTEQDFSTSAITNYCEQRGIKYICVQHGEYGYNPSMAYMRFSEYYAWNKETIENFELVNTAINYAIIYTPEQLKPKFHKNINPQFYLTYYLSGEDKKDILRIKDVLLRFVESGYACCVRPHPKSPLLNYVIATFDQTGIEIENSAKVSIESSICNTTYIVAYRSTVLSKGFVNGMPIIIDDVSGDIEMLKRAHDINIKRATMMLTDLINNTLK